MTTLPPPGQPPNQPGYPPYFIAQPPPVSAAAVVSMVFGILGILIGWCTLAIPCIVAVLAGHQAMRDTIPRGPKTGRGMAIAGLILGYPGVAIAAIVLILWVIGVVSSPYN